jgi:hypothetical protein
MKKNLLRAFLIALSMPLLCLESQAQDDFIQLLQEDIDESKVLIGEYISPFMKSSSLGLNQGWYNTAKNHKLFGVDLTVTVSAMGIPKDESSFNVSKLGLQHFSLKSGETAPTIFGNDEEPVYIYNNGSGFTKEITGLPGLDLKDKIGRNAMPVPIAHLGIGLPKNTELKVRFVPSVDLNGNGEFNMWGVGVLHDIKQHIPGIKLLPFDLAGFVGYTRMDVVYRPDVSVDVQGENQRSEMRMSATTVQVLISKKVSVLTGYAGVGYNIAKSNLGIKGTYDLNDDGDTADAHEINPLDLNYSASGARVTAGLRIKLAVLTLHADYTFQKYNAFSAGVGISVR